ncbi:MAG TPA: DUF4878 domain-containing protein [Candidatus Barnesiella excrementigallinarum]|nr:DUF4878 domain-containing protein [Candidatus Barnesiella excrementigallinarum]
MKRVLYLSMMVAALFMMASCSSSSSDSPSKALNGYVDELKAGNYEKFVEGIAFKDGLSDEEIQSGKAMWVGLLQDKGAKEFEKRGGLKGIEIISEEISEDGNSAVVTFKQMFGDGTETEDTQNMVKKDGKWLMDVNK